MSIWSRLHVLVDQLAARRCHHPKDIVCEHRHWAYDIESRGYSRGFHAGKKNVEAKWLGNLTGEGVYADYPPPRPKP